jgi:hypothetical protein
MDRRIIKKIIFVALVSFLHLIHIFQECFHVGWLRMSAKILHIWNDRLDWLKKNRIKIFHVENMVYFQQNNFPSSNCLCNWSCEFASRSGEVCSMQHYVIKHVSDLRQVGVFSGYSGFLHRQSWPPRYMTEILLKGVLNPHFFSSSCFCNYI